VEVQTHPQKLWKSGQNPWKAGRKWRQTFVEKHKITWSSFFNFWRSYQQTVFMIVLGEKSRTKILRESLGKFGQIYPSHPKNGPTPTPMIEMIHVTYITYVFRTGSSFRPNSARCEVPCWQQQLKLNAKAQTNEAVAQEQATEPLFCSYNVLPQPSVLSVALRTNFDYQLFYFQVRGNMAEENILYQQLQKLCRRTFAHKVFRASLGIFGQHIGGVAATSSNSCQGCVDTYTLQRFAQARNQIGRNRAIAPTEILKNMFSC